MRAMVISPSLVHSGTERVVSEIVNEWTRGGHKIHLLTFYIDEDFYKIDPAFIAAFVYVAALRKGVMLIKFMLKIAIVIMGLGCLIIGIKYYISNFDFMDSRRSNLIVRKAFNCVL